MNSNDDLNRTFDVHAPDPVSSVRRRRAAVGALAVAAIATGSWLAASDAGARTAPTPAREPIASRGAPADLAFPQQGHYLYELSEAVVGDPGAAATGLRTVLPRKQHGYAVHCVPPTGAAGGAEAPWASIVIDGWTALLLPCDEGPADDIEVTTIFGVHPDPDQNGLSTFSSGSDPEHLTSDERITQALPYGSEVDLELKLTDEEGRPYSGPADGVRLALGLYVWSPTD